MSGTDLSARPRAPKPIWQVGLLLILGLVCTPPAWAGYPSGKWKSVVQLDESSITLFGYKPTGFSDGPLILVFHGSERKPERARNGLVSLAEREKAIIVAPLLDEEHFPRWRYQFAGIAEPVKAGQSAQLKEQPRDRWTGQLLLRIVEHIRRAEGRADLPYYMIGHSAGAQLLGRFAAFLPHEARRLVLANAGSYVWPDQERKFPYGFGGLSSALSRPAEICRYLAQPITVLVGDQDLLRQGLDKSRGARSQGATRRERAFSVYYSAREIAAQHRWSFNWQLIEVPGVGHDSRAMYGSPEAAAALFDSPATLPAKC